MAKLTLQEKAEKWAYNESRWWDFHDRSVAEKGYIAGYKSCKREMKKKGWRMRKDYAGTSKDVRAKKGKWQDTGGL